MEVFILSVAKDGYDIGVEGDPFVYGMSVTEVKVDAVITFPSKAKVEGTFFFNPQGFEYSHEFAEKKIRELFLD